MSAPESMTSVGRFQVRKLGYSVRPWRIVEAATGRECWTHEIFDHPNLGKSQIDAPMSYDRKRDALAALREMEGLGAA